MDISKYFRESLGIRDNESQLYINIQTDTNAWDDVDTDKTVQSLNYLPFNKKRLQNLNA